MMASRLREDTIARMLIEAGADRGIVDHVSFIICIADLFSTCEYYPKCGIRSTRSLELLPCRLMYIHVFDNYAFIKSIICDEEKLYLSW